MDGKEKAPGTGGYRGNTKATDNVQTPIEISSDFPNSVFPPGLMGQIAMNIYSSTPGLHIDTAIFMANAVVCEFMGPRFSNHKIPLSFLAKTVNIPPLSEMILRWIDECKR